MQKEIINLGDMVACDYCNQDSFESGGIYFSGYAICPKCSVGALKTIVECDEEEFITARCPEGKSFHDWVIEDLRNGQPGTIEITSW